MQKIDTLRAAITAAVPELRQNPERLAIWIEQGNARCAGTKTEAFGFNYQANVLIKEMASDISVVALAVFRWLRVNQPALLAPNTNTNGFSFDVDILDNRCADVLLKIQIDENVTVTAGAGGGVSLAYLPEPDPLFDDDLGLGGADPIPPLDGIEIAEDLPPWEP